MGHVEQWQKINKRLLAKNKVRKEKAMKTVMTLSYLNREQYEALAWDQGLVSCTYMKICNEV